MYIAVNQMLLRERKELSGFGKVGTFDGSNCGEGPACAAAVLILDRGNTPFLNPVDVLGRI